MVRLACTGDNHIDEKATAGGKLVLGPDGRSIRAADRERCLVAVAEGAVERGVDAVLHSGDLFDTARPTPAEYVIAERFVDRICLAGIPLIAAGCNHGLPQSLIEQHALAPLIGRQANLHILLRPEAITIETKAGPLQLAGLPWPQRSLLAAEEPTAGLSPEGLNALISRKLATIIRSFLATRRPGIPLVLLGHVMLREALFSNDETAPETGQIVLSAQDLAGFDAAILGDIHRAQSFGAEGRIFYTGSTDRVSFGEESEAKGFWLVTLEGDRFSKELIETPARKYLTYRHIEEAKLESFEPADLATDPIVRVKATLMQEEYDALAPHLARWRAYPLFIEEIEITRQTSARSAEMQAEISDVHALTVWHRENNRPEDLGQLLAVHREIAGARQ